MTTSELRSTPSALPPLSRLVWALAGVTLGFHLATAHGYGIFRDELYYLACADHLGLGYVDHPPLIAWITAAVRGLLGTSLPALRALPAVAAAATAATAGGIARELGGQRFAQALAVLATAVAPGYLALASTLSMNAFDLLFWAALAWILVRLLRTGEPRLWLAFGAVAGLGLENKLSVLFLGFGVVVGLLLARRFEQLTGPWLWAGGALALLLFAPHLIWQAVHGWPTLEFMERARAVKMVRFSPLSFLAEQLRMAGPAGLLVWVAGLGTLLAARRFRAYRTLGWAFLAILGVMIAAGAKPYYLVPAYSFLFAAGGVAWEGWSRRWGGRWLRGALVGLVLLAGALVAPLAKPLLPVEDYAAYAERLGMAPSTDERHELARLAQFFADMHGWPELARAVDRVHEALPPEERSRACVFAQNYGQAGAVDHFGDELGLPPVMSGHNSYHLWGPGECSGEVVIVIGGSGKDLERVFAEVEAAATYRCRYCMPYEDDKILWVARDPRVSLAEFWPRLKHYD